MAKHGNPKLNNPKITNGRLKHNRKRAKKSQIEDDEIKTINDILLQQAPQRGTNPLAISNPEKPTFATARKFDELPISQYTKNALKDVKYVNLTAIQRAALPHALCGRDVLGAAKTGSGKTLAFVLPLIERLYRSKWSKLDGLGALIVSPTRELALQIFEELRKVGKFHEFSAGLLIGGKDVEEERAVLHGLNILVCTPGRLLQHMDETPGFDASDVQVLVLDEADRILDMGFSATLNAIVENLPKDRQTLLFSATQTKSVSTLARLSLKDPEYVSVHAEAEAPTPVRLQQAYMVCELHEKMDILWSFIKTHLKAKVIVFFSTCKQVKFAYEAFKRLRPGTPLRALHGRMSQFKRLAAFEQFNAATGAVLFATDIAARGLDFPSVDWVVQADCPEDVASYIHRVGRTARYTSSGKSLMLLVPSEKTGMLKQLEEAKVPVKLLKHNPAKLQPVTPALQALLSKDAELKEVAQRAVVSYLRSTFLQPNREVFDVSQLPVAEYALSMGLPTAPKLRFLKKGQHQKKGNEVQHSDHDMDEKNGLGEESDDDTSSEEDEQHAVVKSRNGKDSATAKKAFNTVDENNEDDDDDLLVVKRRDVLGALDDTEQQPTTTTTETAVINPNKKRKKMKINPNRATGTRTVFDDEGQEVDPLSLLADGGSDGDYDNVGGDNNGIGLYSGVHSNVAERAAAARAVLAARDKEDRAKLRDLKKAKRVEKRAKRLAREAQGADGMVATLGGHGMEYSDDEEYSSDEGSDRDGTEYFSASEDDEDRRIAHGYDNGVDLLESSSDEEEDRRRKRKKGRKSGGMEVAHMDMALKKPVVSEKKKKKAPNLSLADQEALALQLLKG